MSRNVMGPLSDRLRLFVEEGLVEERLLLLTSSLAVVRAPGTGKYARSISRAALSFISSGVGGCT